MGLTALRGKINIHGPTQIKPCSSWRYIEVLRHETIGLNSIYIILYLWSAVNMLWYSRRWVTRRIWRHEWRMRATSLNVWATGFHLVLSCVFFFLSKPWVPLTAIIWLTDCYRHGTITGIEVYRGLEKSRFQNHYNFPLYCFCIMHSFIFSFFYELSKTESAGVVQWRTHESQPPP